MLSFVGNNRLTKLSSYELVGPVPKRSLSRLCAYAEVLGFFFFPIIAGFLRFVFSRHCSYWALHTICLFLVVFIHSRMCKSVGHKNFDGLTFFKNPYSRRNANHVNCYLFQLTLSRKCNRSLRSVIQKFLMS